MESAKRTSGPRSRRSAAIAVSWRSRCPLTSAGGVSAIHWLSEMSLYFGGLKTLISRTGAFPSVRSRHESQLVFEAEVHFSTIS